MPETVMAKIDMPWFPATVVRARYPTAQAAVPDELLAAWIESAGAEFKGIPLNAMFFARSLEALLMFFDCVSRSGQQCGLPSRAADSVWHAWSRLDQGSLDRFCADHFGSPIQHVEAVKMKMGAAVANCLVESRRLLSRPPASPSLPPLFTVDRDLKMPNGFGYKISLGLVGFWRLDEGGEPHGEIYYPELLTPYGLFHAGLISQAEYDVGARLAATQCEPRTTSDVEFFGGLGTHAGDGCNTDGGDGSGGDAGGGDGGGSCGGGCGGGCGS